MVTEVTHESWGGRLMSSIKGVLFGLLLFIGSFALLWWNEGRAVKTYRTLNEVRDTTVSVTADTVASEHDGGPVHVTGEADADGELTDPEFGVSTPGVRLRRQVEMYQWEEDKETHTKKKVGGGTTKTTEYTYDKTWSGRLIDSGSFKERSGHENPGQMPYNDLTLNADNVILGSFTLSPSIVRDMDFYESVSPKGAKLPNGAELQGNYVYLGEASGSPQIGDVRISFQAVPEGTVSVIAQQSGAELTPWRASSGKSYSRIQQGAHSLTAMMDQAESEARMVTWLLRGGGWLMMAIGISLVLRPLSVFGDVIPFIGSLVGGGIAVVAGLVSAVLTLVTIAVAWIAVRPLVGVPLLVIAAALLFLQWKKSRADKTVIHKAAAQTPPPPPPPPPAG